MAAQRTSESEMRETLVFRTSRLFEADQFAAALDEREVPYFRRMDSGGVEQAMPAAPADFFGIFWSLYVPAEVAEEAREILEGMPFDPDRDAAWQPSERDHRNWRRFSILFPIAAAIALWFRYCS